VRSLDELLLAVASHRSAKSFSAPEDAWFSETLQGIWIEAVRTKRWLGRESSLHRHYVSEPDKMFRALDVLRAKGAE